MLPLTLHELSSKIVHFFLHSVNFVLQINHRFNLKAAQPLVSQLIGHILITKHLIGGKSNIKVLLTLKTQFLKIISILVTMNNWMQ